MNSRADNIIMNFNIENIGPILKMQNSIDIGKSNRLLIYANNGTGKSFLGRCFREFEKSTFDKDNYDLLSFNKSEGNFKFDFMNANQTAIEDISFKVSKNNIISDLSQSSNYIYHVFNSDYVDSNIKSYKYARGDDDYKESVIMGAGQIDTADLEEEKELYEDKVTQIISNLENLKERSLDSLKTDFEVHPSLSEYKDLNQLNILDSIKDIEKEDFEESLIGYDPASFIEDVEIDKASNILNNHRDDYEQIKGVDEKDIKILTALSEYKCFDFSDVETLLKTEDIPVLTGHEGLKDFVKSYPEFVEVGLGIYKEDDKCCPFCKESTDGLLTIIDNYKTISDSEEEKFRRNIKSNIDKLDLQIKILRKLESDRSTITANVLHNKEKLVIKEDINFDEIKVDPLIDKINDVKLNLEIKKEEYSATFDNLDDLLQNIKVLESSLIENVDAVNTKVPKINERFTKIKDAKKDKRKLAILVLKEYIMDLDLFNILPHLKYKLKEINENIIKEQSKVKKERKELALDTLKYLLGKFFAGKYSIDNDFILKTYSGDNIKGSSLSDGEKTILAFCYYMSDVHCIVESDSDYQKIYFIIDDPISSLDDNYIYSMSSVIKYLDDESIFSVKINELKYIILSHNLHFINILYNNKVISNLYELKKGASLDEITLKKVQKHDLRFSVPYMSHLQDIYNVSINGTDCISHTTGNSIRQVLEGIQRFVDPNFKSRDPERQQLPHSQSLQFFIHESSKESQGIEFSETKGYIVANNESHTDLFFNNPSIQDIDNVCKSLIKDIENSVLSGQLNNIKEAQSQQV